jgi:prepilin-type N-terminal cleavage/methylation domain-containing protein
MRRTLTTRRWRGGQAFTLLEITIVLVIVSLMLAVTIPTFGPLRMKGELRTSSRNLAALIHYARNAAIFGHHTIKLRIDVEQRKYRLDLMTDSIPASKRDADKIEMIEAVRDLPGKVYFDRIILYEATDKAKEGVVVLDFTPRGSVTPATIVLADPKGRRMTVDVFGTTGAVEVYAGAPPEPTSDKEKRT